MEKLINVQKTYEVLKIALVKDLETEDKFHNHTFGAVMGIVSALEAVNAVKSVGLPLEVSGQ